MVVRLGELVSVELAPLARRPHVAARWAAIAQAANALKALQAKAPMMGGHGTGHASFFLRSI